MMSQLTEKSIEGTECKQNGEKQVIVYNYYIKDGREGWKQVEKSEIPPNVLNDKIRVELAKNPQSRLESVLSYQENLATFSVHPQRRKRR